MKRKALAVGIILLFVGTGIIPGIAQNTEKPSLTTSRGNWLYVGGSGPGNYTSIQDAINDAADRDTIFVYDDSSPYNESLNITKTIILLGENKLTTIINGWWSGYNQVIYLKGKNIVISNFTIQHSTYGLFCEITNSKISNLIINDTGCAIYLEKSSQNIISNNRINSYQDICILLYYFSTNNIIINNSLPDASTSGIYLREGCNKNQIVKNSIQNKIEGIVIEWSFYNMIRKNNFIKNDLQANFQNSSFNLFLGNYWNDWIVKKPRPIEGVRFGLFTEDCRAWTIYDLRPAQEPYDIGV
jgi:nitrous oxidase accessory protein